MTISWRFAFAVWGPPSDNPWMTTVRDVVAQFVELPRADPDAPGPFRSAQAAKLHSLTNRFTQIERDGAVLLAARVHLVTGRSSS